MIFTEVEVETRPAPRSVGNTRHGKYKCTHCKASSNDQAAMDNHIAIQLETANPHYGYTITL